MKSDHDQSVLFERWQFLAGTKKLLKEDDAKAGESGGTEVKGSVDSMAAKIAQVTGVDKVKLVGALKKAEPKIEKGEQVTVQELGISGDMVKALANAFLKTVFAGEKETTQVTKALKTVGTK